MVEITMAIGPGNLSSSRYDLHVPDSSKILLKVFQFQHELSSCHKSSVHVSAVSVVCMTHQVSVSCEADQESVATHGVPGHDDWNIFHLKSQTCHQYCLA